MIFYRRDKSHCNYCIKNCNRKTRRDNNYGDGCYGYKSITEHEDAPHLLETAFSVLLASVVGFACYVVYLIITGGLK